MLNQQIYEEASEWFTRMRDREVDAALRVELMTWLRRSPEHVSAYLDIAAIWMEAKNVEADGDLDLATRIERARADLGVADLVVERVGHFAPVAEGGLSSTDLRPSAGSVVDGRKLAHLPPSEKRSRRTWRRFGFAAAASILLAASVAWFFGQRNTFTTGTGEQRSLTLTDGSALKLNSRSAVRLRFSATERAVDLLEGQALFEVRKDTARPFIVNSDGTRVRAVGTQFDVYRKSTGTVVTVLEGRVAVSSPPLAVGEGAAGKDSSSLLSAGEQLTIAPQLTSRPVRTNVAAATAWTQNQLVFEFTPLAEAVEEFNRYNARRLVVESEQLRAFKISAIFRSTDPGSLVRYMQTQPGVRIQETADAIRIAPALD